MKKISMISFALLSTLPVAAVSSVSSTKADDAKRTSIERASSTEKGKLTNPLTVTPEIIAEAKDLYQTKTCGACHGGNGGGIHCPSLINDAWIYGDDDDTLFRLVVLGSGGMASAGYSRGDEEKHAWPMPNFGESITDEHEIWKIIAHIRSLNSSSAAK